MLLVETIKMNEQSASEERSSLPLGGRFFNHDRSSSTHRCQLPSGNHVIRSADDLIFEVIEKVEMDVVSIDRQIEALRADRRRMQEKLRRLQEAHGVGADSGVIEVQVPRIDSMSVSKAVRAVARELAIRLKRPIRRTEILASLKAAGIAVGGRDPAKTVTRVMSRAKDEFTHDGEGYALADVDG
jgi:hypothetical protein